MTNDGDALELNPEMRQICLDSEKGQAMMENDKQLRRDARSGRATEGGPHLTFISISLVRAVNQSRVNL